MIDTWNPAKLNEKISGRDSWNPAILNEAVTDRDSWNPAILNESAGDTPVEFEATITVTYPSGATVTCSDGTITLTADENPMIFSIPNEGTWTVACVANGVTLSEDVVITTNGQTETIDLTPDGATVTPTDSVSMLIACAGIGDSEITTIAGALADVDTLTAILESENAVDYLVRSTTFASAVTADSVAMTGIGAINYDADTLLADSTWLAAICNSTYFESVLNAKVPTMTSDTAPSGVCSTSQPTYAGYEAYKAFDNNDSTSTQTTTFNTNKEIQYQFASPVNVYRFDFLATMGESQPSPKLKLECSDDGVTYSTVVNDVPFTNGVKYSAAINGGSHAYWKISTTLNTNSYLVANTIQFYGRQDV